MPKKHYNRTVVMFLGISLQEYHHVISQRELFLAAVTQADMADSFPGHKPHCPRLHRFTRHSHYVRKAIPYTGAIYTAVIWQVRCLDCGGVFTIMPAFLLRYQRLDARAVANLLQVLLVMNVSYRHGRLIFGFSQPELIKDPRTLWRLVQWLGRSICVTQLLLTLGLKPPSHVIEDEKFTSENGAQTYIPAVLDPKTSLIWWIDYTPQVDEDTLRASFQRFAATLGRWAQRIKGATTDGWKAGKRALRAVWGNIHLQECLIHAQKQVSLALVRFRKAHPRKGKPWYIAALWKSYWEVLTAPTPQAFAQRLRHLPKDFKTDPILKPRLRSARLKMKELSAHLGDRGLALFTTRLDQVFKFLDRKLFQMQTFRVSNSGVNTVNAWAIVHNFWRYMPGARNEGKAPVELAGFDLLDIPWIEWVNWAISRASP